MDLYKNYMAVSVGWGSYFGSLYEGFHFWGFILGAFHLWKLTYFNVDRYQEGRYTYKRFI